jgi:hypothetical protein
MTEAEEGTTGMIGMVSESANEDKERTEATVTPRLKV